MEKIVLSLLSRARKKKAVLLDLDNTLYPYAPCHRQALRESHILYCERLEKISQRAFQNQYEKSRENVKKWTRKQAASHSRLLYFKDMVERCGQKPAIDIPLQLESAYWRAFLSKIKRKDWVLPFLKDCKKKGLRVIIVTDLTTAIQSRKIIRLGIGAWVDRLVTSEEAGIEKPNPKIFRLALKKAGCERREALIIGDDPEKDGPPGFDFVLI